MLHAWNIYQRNAGQRDLFVRDAKENQLGEIRNVTFMNAELVANKHLLSRNNYASLSHSYSGMVLGSLFGKSKNRRQSGKHFELYC